MEETNKQPPDSVTPLPIQMTDDTDMDAPWWELVVIVVALVLAFTFGIFVGRWTA